MKSSNRMPDEEIVESKLKHFINKFYRVKMFQGLIITASAALVVLLSLIVLGNLLVIGETTQTIFLIIGIVLLVLVFMYFIGKPLFQLFGLIGGLNFKDASNIIQQKHKTIEDRIINIIELSKEKVGKTNNLYESAIAQKSEKVEIFNFDDAISFKRLGIFVIRLIVIVIVFAGIVIAWPDFVRRGIGTMGLGTTLESGVGAISFKVLNDSLEVESGNDFLLRFDVSSAIPVENVSVMFASATMSADRVGDAYEFLFRAVNAPVSFRLTAGGTISGEFVLKTLKKPEIGGIQLKIIPPGYTGLGSLIIENDGNSEVPSGSRIIWSVRTVNTDELIMVTLHDSVNMDIKGNYWVFENTVSNDFNYELICKNKNGLFNNYLYRISIVQDLFPTIDISESRDSTVSEDVYIQGIIQDDYGFSKLELISDRLGVESKTNISIKASSLNEAFFYKLTPDSTNTIYFFRVWDNDRVKGPKFADSRRISLRSITKAEIENINSQLVDSIKSNISEGMSAVDKLEKKLSEFKIESVVGDLKPWEIQEKLKELNELKNDVVDLLNNISKADKEFTENENILNEDKEFNERIKQLQELMESLLDDELKELLKQFEDLAKEFNSQKADEVTEKMELNLDKLKEQMEMSMELLKKYNMEKDLLKQAGKLDQLADSLQRDKSQDAGNNNVLKEEFKKWESEYEKNLKEDQGLKKPMGLEDLKEERDEVRNDADQLEQSKDGKSSSAKKSKAAQSLKKLSKKLKKMMGAKSSSDATVDLEDLRQIRNSLNDFSIKQEELNKRISNVVLINPTFTAVIKDQKGLENKFLGIRDSLKSLGYKQPLIAKMIGSELFHVETSLKNLFQNYSDGKTSVVRIEQNQIMSEANMMAVKIDELVTAMQKTKGNGKGESSFTDRKKKSDGDQSGSEKVGQTKSMQQSLKEQLKNSIEKMKSGSSGKKERGDMARMLAQREMMRKALEKVIQDGELGKEGKDRANEALNMMKEVEKDVIYNRLSDQTLNKDNLITTKLLEAENAEKERENENRRESKEFKGNFEPYRNDPGKSLDQNKLSEQTLKYNELKLKKFYQEKYLKYIESIKK